MPEELREAQGAPKRDTQKAGQPPSCFSAPICAPCPTALPAPASSPAGLGSKNPHGPQASLQDLAPFQEVSGLDELDDLGEAALSSLPHHRAATMKMASPRHTSSVRAFADEAFRFPHQIRDNGQYLT